MLYLENWVLVVYSGRLYFIYFPTIYYMYKYHVLLFSVLTIIYCMLLYCIVGETAEGS